MSVKNPLLVLVLLNLVVHPYHMIMVMVTRNLNLEKCQELMEILKNFPGGKPTSTVMSWVLMKHYGTYWKTVLVT